MKNRVRAAIVAAIVLLPATAGAQIMLQSSAQPPPGITVAGTGYDREALVDTRVNAVVVIGSKQLFSNGLLDPIVDALKLSGVSPVTTTALGAPNQPITLLSIGGHITDISHLDTLRATVVAAASTIPGASLPTITATGRVPNCADAQQRATIAAIKAARIRAALIAAAADVRLGKMTALDVVQNQSAQTDGNCVVTTSITPPGRPFFGNTSIAVTVTMTFAIK